MEQLHATLNTSCDSNSAEQPVEKRIAHDGVSYTYHEIQQWYGFDAGVYWSHASVDNIEPTHSVATSVVSQLAPTDASKSRPPPKAPPASRRSTRTVAQPARTVLTYQ